MLNDEWLPVNLTHPQQLIIKHQTLKIKKSHKWMLARLFDLRPH